MTRPGHRPPTSVVVLLLAAALGACGSSEGNASPAVAPNAVKASQRSCPTVTSPDLGPQNLEDSDLVSVAPRVHGRHLQYRVDGAKLQVYVGIDVADRAEDLDFLGSPEVVNGRDVVFLHSTAVPRILIVEWTDSRFAAPCDQIGVFTEGLDEATVRRIVAGITVHPAAAGQEDAARTTG